MQPGHTKAGDEESRASKTCQALRELPRLAQGSGAWTGQSHSGQSSSGNAPPFAACDSLPTEEAPEAKGLCKTPPAASTHPKFTAPTPGAPLGPSGSCRAPCPRAEPFPFPSQSPPRAPTSRQHPPHPTGSPPGATSTGRPGHSGCATAGRHRAEPCQAGPSPPAPFPAPLRQHRVPTGSPQLPPGSPRRGRPPADIAAAPPLPAPLRPGPAPPAMGRLSGAARPERGRDGDGDEAWAAERWPVIALGAPRACPRDAEMPRSRP